MDYSDPSYVNDPENSSGSFDQLESPTEFEANYFAVARETTLEVPPAVGFGQSVYGVPSTAITVARTGDAVGNRTLFRLDLQPLYRWDSRPPEVVFREGFQPWNGDLPVSLQSYQNTLQRSAYVSTTRDPAPDREMIERAIDANSTGQNVAYRYTIWVPGGVDMTASLNRAAYSSQQEVLFYKGILPTYISEARAFDRDLNERDVWFNPNADGAREVYRQYQAGLAAHSSVASAQGNVASAAVMSPPGATGQEYGSSSTPQAGPAYPTNPADLAYLAYQTNLAYQASSAHQASSAYETNPAYQTSPAYPAYAGGAAGQGQSQSQGRSPGM